MTQSLEDFAEDQRVRGDAELARDIWDALDDQRDLTEWYRLDRTPAEAFTALEEHEALIAECERCESLNFDDDEPVKSLRAGLKRLEAASDEMIDIRDLLVQGGYLAKDDRKTPLASLIAQFMPPLGESS